ncbi:MAG: type II toxin-antitoxin system HigB family toxin [Candidatus Obscuribacterales bacterium]|nr:type II toxin-antitoxin system HigB family toxin [Candidatus Obscuribacterales bacterium]
MNINNLRAINKFQVKHPDCRTALDRWVKLTQIAQWKRLLDVQATFPSAEDVKGWIVFNIKGNSYRLISTIRYPEREVDIHEIMTHEQYDRWKP